MPATIAIFHSYADYQALLSEALAEEGYNILTAKTYAGALASLNQHPQLIVLDLHISHWNDGLDLIADVRSRTDFANIPIVISCVDTDALNKHASLLRQLDAVEMRHPWDTAELLAIVRLLIGNA